MTQPAATETPARLNLIAWSDPVIEALGHRPGAAYIEAVWVGVLGPSPTWAWMRLARQAAVHPASVVDVIDLAVSLGLGEGLGRHASISRTLSRLGGFDVVHMVGDTIAVRLALPDVPERRLARLSHSSRLAHERLARARR